jgi:ubiquinone/menaquinone biosynthesis C-methylase UbiE
MDIMHPLRHKMIEVCLEVLPFRAEDDLSALDLGVGTGALAQGFLERFSRAKLLAVDGAEAMIELAPTRLGPLAARCSFLRSPFQELPPSVLGADSYDVVFSSYALHHLTAGEKRSLMPKVVDSLKTGGWFLNADIFVARDQAVEARIQALRVGGILGRAPTGDARFSTAETARAFLDEMEALERDQPQPLDVELEILRQSGLKEPEVLWKEYREAVLGGRKA